jgi:putative aldouronate transport system substrate-binding protein
MMSKRFIRICCILIVAAMMSTLIGCSQSTEQQDETTTGTTAAATTTKAVTTTTTQTTTAKAETTTAPVEENPFAEFYEVTWISGFGADYEEGAYDELMIEEKYNIDLKVWNISYYDAEGLTMMLAAGDIPDISYIPYAPMDAIQLYEEGFTRTIPLEFYKKYFPYYYEQMEKHAPTSFMYNNVPGTEEYYGISFIQTTWKNYYNGPIFRLDWLENIGYEIPESELTPIPLTDEKLGKYNGKLFVTDYMFEFDEMNDIFRAFTEDDPDGNGEDDTYAAVLFDHTFRSAWVDLYWGMFGVNSSENNYLYLEESTGDVVPWFAYSGYRDYLAWANEMHEKGYMRTLDLSDGAYWYDVLLATWLTGKVGFFTADRQYIGRPHFPEYSDRQPPQSLWLNGLEDATFVCMPVLKGPGEVWGNRRYGLEAFADGKWRTFNVSKAVSDGELQRILTMWNDRYSNPLDDWNVKVYIGIEGVHFKWEGEPWKSAMITTEADKVPPQYRRAGFFGGSFLAESLYYSHEAAYYYYTFAEEHDWVKKYCLEPYKYISKMQMGADLYDQYIEEYNEYSGSINAAVSDFANRAWRGEIADLNTEWQQYINQLYAAGLEVIIDKYYNNDAFPVYKRPEF